MDVRQHVKIISNDGENQIGSIDITLMHSGPLIDASYWTENLSCITTVKFKVPKEYRGEIIKFCN